ncbi:MAG: hypothetical protein JHD16_17120, partial [Solirubrobacteraceae bacterium]|nr:hypothetical protein [Solirubrobacteraceae bacterium]
TYRGLAAYAVPGNDRYSRQQGVSRPGPGGVEAQADRVVMETLDTAIPVPIWRPEPALPGSLAIALLLRGHALSINPWAAFGPFSAPFANLKFAQKRTALRALDDSPLLKEAFLEYAPNALVTLAAFGAYSERAVYDRRSRKLSARPIGWDLANYGGVSDGWPEFQGYYGGVQEARA